MRFSRHVKLVADPEHTRGIKVSHLAWYFAIPEEDLKNVAEERDTSNAVPVATAAQPRISRRKWMDRIPGPLFIRSWSYLS